MFKKAETGLVGGPRPGGPLPPASAISPVAFAFPKLNQNKPDQLTDNQPSGTDLGNLVLFDADDQEEHDILRTKSPYDS